VINRKLLKKIIKTEKRHNGVINRRNGCVSTVVVDFKSLTPKPYPA
jgi:hypothetical protein